VTLGDVFAAAGDRGRAKSLYEQALALLLEHARPYALDAARRLADMLESDGDTSGALRVLKSATVAA
jgi:hypothetical protein